MLKKFANPHIIKFIEAFENPGEVILIMEYLDGGELFERVADEDFNLTESDCCLFMRQICRGVQYLHDTNIVHLDLKVMLMRIEGWMLVRYNPGVAGSQ